MIEMIVYLQDYTYFQFIPFWHRKSILILRPELHPLAPSAARSVPVVASLRRHFWHAGREGYKTRSWWGNLWKPCSYKNWNGTNLLRIPNTFWEQALGRWRRWIPRKLLLEEGSIEWLPARRASSLASQEPLAKMTWSQVVALYQWHVASPTTADHCMKMKKKIMEKRVWPLRLASLAHWCEPTSDSNQIQEIPQVGQRVAPLRQPCALLQLLYDSWALCNDGVMSDVYHGMWNMKLCCSYAVHWCLPKWSWKLGGRRSFRVPLHHPIIRIIRIIKCFRPRINSYDRWKIHVEIRRCRTNGRPRRSTTHAPAKKSSRITGAED